MMSAIGYKEGGPLPDQSWIVGLTAPLAIVTDDGDGPRFSQVSAGFLQAMEWTRAETAGRSFEQLFPVQTYLILTNAFQRLVRSGEVVQVIAPVRRSRDQTSPTLFTLQPVAGGAAIEIASAAEHRDGAVGWRQVLFQQLNLMGSGAAAIYDRSPSVAADLGALLGFPEGGSHDEAALVHPEDMPRLAAHRRRLSKADEGLVARITLRMRHANGSWRWIEIREEMLNRTIDGALGQVLGFAIDVSEHHALLEASQQQSIAVMQAEAEERRRIARELHDTMAQYLVAIDLALAGLQRAAGPSLPSEPVADIRNALRSAHEEVRSFSWLLHPPDIERLGLARAIAKFAAGFGKRTGLTVVTDADDIPPLPAASELALFRITQEALMNVHRHARASQVRLQLKQAGGHVSLDVIDDGVGLAGATLDPALGEGTGVGLSGMNARLQHLSGAMAVMPAAKGFHLRVSVPADPAAGQGPGPGG